MKSKTIKYQYSIQKKVNKIIVYFSRNEKRKT